MLQNELPELVNPDKLCRLDPSGGTKLEGKMVVNDGGTSHIVWVSLLFSIDREGYARVEGKLECRADLTCQRCLEPMEHQISAFIKISPVASDEAAKKLPVQYEPLLVSNGEIAIREWIAEEIHLAWPIAPRHDEGRCEIKLE